MQFALTQLQNLKRPFLAQLQQDDRASEPLSLLFFLGLLGATFLF